MNETIDQIKNELAEYQALVAKRPELRPLGGKWPVWMESLITTIESQKEEIAEAKRKYEFWENHCGRSELRIESLKAITELKNEMLQDAEKRILAVIESRDKLQGITELAVKGFQEIMSMNYVEGRPSPEQSIAIHTHTQIRKLSNGTT